jgi:hypothetical protein
MLTFRHRQNPDGTWDSICEDCFFTAVLGAKGEASLRAGEYLHVCKVSVLGGEIQKVYKKPVN